VKKSIENSYLSYINDPLDGNEDKLELLKYLHQTENALTVLEVGPGAGSALAAAISLSQRKKNPDEYFVSDIDMSILKNLKEDPIISQYDRINYLHHDILKASYPNNFFDIYPVSFF
jgi:16S rRNA A1518/A1519 N6-dimethyltransferase RsmA/KsgA/DIM1 with predicted DNA glycosylase/AP lyase activity